MRSTWLFYWGRNKRCWNCFKRGFVREIWTSFSHGEVEQYTTSVVVQDPLKALVFVVSILFCMMRMGLPFFRCTFQTFFLATLLSCKDLGGRHATHSAAYQCRYWETATALSMVWIVSRKLIAIDMYVSAYLFWAFNFRMMAFCSAKVSTCDDLAYVF